MKIQNPCSILSTVHRQLSEPHLSDMQFAVRKARVNCTSQEGHASDGGEWTGFTGAHTSVWTAFLVPQHAAVSPAVSPDHGTLGAWPCLHRRTRGGAQKCQQV